ncbi:MAG: hypothetical protein IBJ14_08545 [Hydrogenophaga sp.]|nr:hypothetical protein [Hydrogenophaga sp.]
MANTRTGTATAANPACERCPLSSTGFLFKDSGS